MLFQETVEKHVMGLTNYVSESKTFQVSTYSQAPQWYDVIKTVLKVLHLYRNSIYELPVDVGPDEEFLSNLTCKDLRTCVVIKNHHDVTNHHDMIKR